VGEGEDNYFWGHSRPRRGLRPLHP
jgi:hypothetical protein